MNFLFYVLSFQVQLAQTPEFSCAPRAAPFELLQVSCHPFLRTLLPHSQSADVTAQPGKVGFTPLIPNMVLFRGTFLPETPKAQSFGELQVRRAAQMLDGSFGDPDVPQDLSAQGEEVDQCSARPWQQ